MSAPLRETCLIVSHKDRTPPPRGRETTDKVKGFRCEDTYILSNNSSNLFFSKSSEDKIGS